jgi:pimeloyl-ACP methyl ester carboxylesterase
LLSVAPRGDGRPVMVLPGFATSDRMTLLLRHFLGLLGYRVFPWNLGWNFDHHTVGANGEHIARQIERIRSEVDEDVSLVGWSLGGVVAREAARRNPTGVRQVIALGSPFAGDPKATNLSLLYSLATGKSARSEEAVARARRGVLPLPVPSSAIFSRSDGITAWQNCVGATDAINENIEVRSSHFGFVLNPAVYLAVADRLAQERQNWRPFERTGHLSELYFPAVDSI